MTAAGAPPLGDLPALPLGEDGPVFREPWQATAFALTLRLHEAGHFTWPEWVDHLSAEIGAAKASGDPDLGDTYYHYWLTALEKLVAHKQLINPSELSARKDEWADAVAHTEHGAPILLENAKGGATT